MDGKALPVRECDRKISIQRESAASCDYISWNKPKLGEKYVEKTEDMSEIEEEKTKTTKKKTTKKSTAKKTTAKKNTKKPTTKK